MVHAETAVDRIQSETLKALGCVLEPGSRVALVDFPAHQNAGDSLIYAGERAYLRRLGVGVDYICDFARYDPAVLRARVPEGPILLHGGGNFGDRWPQYEGLRKRVVADFPDRKIVMLPQSMDYGSRTQLESTKRAFGAHNNLTLMLREQRSLAEAVEHFGDHHQVVHCPDMAFGIGLQKSAGGHEVVDLIRLMRGDSERVDRPPVTTSHSSLEQDWGLKGLSQAAWKGVRLPGRVASMAPRTANFLQPVLAQSYRAQSALNLHAAWKTLSLGRVILTDRLHASVFGGLMGTPVVALDNSYGKVRDVYDDYLHTIPGVHFVKTAVEAQQMIETMLD